MRQTPIELAIAAAKGEVRNPRQAKYRDERHKAGMRRISVWVPSDRVVELQQLARQWTQQHEASQSDD